MRWFKLAAYQGLSNAQLNVATKYENGIGVVQDYMEAVRWYKQAAAQGELLAQSNLASMYFSGKGVAKNYPLAYMWSNFAAIKNEEFKKKRNAIASFMTAQQIADAQKLARECQARNFKNCD